MGTALLDTLSHSLLECCAVAHASTYTIGGLTLPPFEALKLISGLCLAAWGLAWLVCWLLVKLDN